MQTLPDTRQRNRGYIGTLKRFPSSAVALSIFAVIFVAFNCVVLNHKCSYWIKWHCFQELKQRLECVVAGNSHAFYAVSPEKLGCDAMSFANVAQSLGTDCILVEKCLEECPNLKLAVFSISYHSLGYTMLADTNHSWRDCYTFLYYGLSEADYWKRFQDLKYFVPSFLIGTERCQKIIRHRFKDPAAASVDESNWVTQRGWAQVWGVPTLTEEEGSKHVAVHNRLNRADFHNNNISKLEAVLEKCKSKNVRVLFFTPPAWKTYRKYLNRTDWSKTQSEIGALCKKYGASYADYLDDSRFGESDFVDDNHLIVGGAAKFSDLLKKEHIDPILAKSN